MVERGSLSCADYELMISKACDDECEPEEVMLLQEHLRECEECRCTLAEFSQLRDVLAACAVSQTCPPLPLLPRTTRLWRSLQRVLSGWTLERAVLVAASFVFFFVGQQTGYIRASRTVPEIPSSSIVATPSMWVADRPVGSAARASVESEQPFTASISRYRSAIGSELRQKKVDWMRVRELVEAMGELRTDLELLTLHMAYLDICTGQPPSKVAEHWERLGGSSDGKEVF